MKIHFYIELTWIAELWQIVSETYAEWQVKYEASKRRAEYRSALIAGEIPRIKIRRKYL